VYLTTGEVEIARKIARAVRNTSGGLRYLKAAGFLVEGQAQVSMNLTNYQKTPVYRIVEMIRSEAARYGVSVAFSELIGLAPSFVRTARWYGSRINPPPDPNNFQHAEAAQRGEAPCRNSIAG
jgi:glutamate formiminotransferase